MKAYNVKIRKRIGKQRIDTVDEINLDTEIGKVSPLHIQAKNKVDALDMAKCIVSDVIHPKAIKYVVYEIDTDIIQEG